MSELNWDNMDWKGGWVMVNHLGIVIGHLNSTQPPILQGG